MSSNETADRIISLEKRITYLQKENEELRGQIGFLKTELTSKNNNEFKQLGDGPDLFLKDIKIYQ